MRKYPFKIHFLVFSLFLFIPSISFSEGFLPKDKGLNIIQGTAPDIFSLLTIGVSGVGTVDVTRDTTVRFKCNYPVTYNFGSGDPWPVSQNVEEYVLVPIKKTTLTLNATVNPTTCNIQEGRR